MRALSNSCVMTGWGKEVGAHAQRCVQGQLIADLLTLAGIQPPKKKSSSSSSSSGWLRRCLSA